MPASESAAAPNRWRCSLHRATGRTDDRSLTEHQDAYHDGATITVMWEHVDEGAVEEPTYADPFVEAIVTALREQFPNITDIQIGEFIAMVDDHVARLKEARNGA